MYQPQQQQQQLPVVYYSNGTFLIFKAEHAIQLRRKRILSQPVTGIVPNGLQGGHTPPYSISPYAVYIIAELNLAHFKRLELKSEISTLNNRSEWEKKSAEFMAKARELFVTQRLIELRKRNITPPANGRNFMNEFDETKVRLTISETTDQGWSSYDEHVMHPEEVKLIIRDHLNKLDSVDELNKLLIYHDLYRRGFYISSGMKFGSDFLVYMGDPVAYHSQYAVRLVQSNSQGLVDLSQIDIHQINSLQRLTHTANKIPLFTTITMLENSSTARVNYWTLPERFYLNPESKNTDFSLLEPDIRSHVDRHDNKVMRLD